MENNKEAIALQEKRQVVGALLEKKQAEYDRLATFQEEQLDSINASKEMDSHDIIENPTENQMREVRLESKALDKLSQEIQYLQGFNNYRKLATVGPGCLVKTSQGNFLIAVPELKFEASGKTYSGISQESPLYQALEGYGEGDSVPFNNQEFKIQSVV